MQTIDAELTATQKVALIARIQDLEGSDQLIRGHIRDLAEIIPCNYANVYALLERNHDINAANEVVTLLKNRFPKQLRSFVFRMEKEGMGPARSNLTKLYAALVGNGFVCWRHVSPEKQQVYVRRAEHTLYPTDGDQYHAHDVLVALLAKNMYYREESAKISLGVPVVNAGVGDAMLLKMFRDTVQNIQRTLEAIDLPDTTFAEVPNLVGHLIRLYLIEHPESEDILEAAPPTYYHLAPHWSIHERFCTAFDTDASVVASLFNRDAACGIMNQIRMKFLSLIEIHQDRLSALGAKQYQRQTTSPVTGQTWKHRFSDTTLVVADTDIDPGNSMIILVEINGIPSIIPATYLTSMGSQFDLLES